MALGARHRRSLRRGALGVFVVRKFSIAAPRVTREGARLQIPTFHVEKFGLVTVERHTELASAGTFLRVFLDGQDVTQDCFVADDCQGYVGRYRRGLDGHVMLNDRSDGPAIDLMVGVVEIRR